MENWNEVRTAYQLARLGTVSAAADALGLHRATVQRHVEQLELMLGEKLFLRGPKGYTPTEAGYEMMRVAQAAEDQFEQLEARIKAQAQLRAGELVVTSMPAVTELIMPALKIFRDRHPDVALRHIASSRALKLERGEAHVAIRTATDAQAPDNVVQAFRSFQMGLFASAEYLARKGLPKSRADLASHDFVAPEESDAAQSSKLYLDWLRALAPEQAIVFRSTNLACVEKAIAAGLGIGFMPEFMEKRPGIQHIPMDDEQRIARLDLVTHVDLHRTPRVQALLQVLKDEVTREI